MGEPRQFVIASDLVGEARFGSFLGLGIGLAVVIAPTFVAELEASVSLIGICILLFTAFSFRQTREMEGDSLEISDAGVFRPTKNEWAQWSEVSGLRQRELLNRIELLDASNRRIAALEFQLEGFEEAIHEVLAHVPVAPSDKTRFRGPSRAEPWIVVAIVIMMMVYAVNSPSVGTSIGGIAVALLLVAGLYTDIRSVSVDSEGVALQRWLRNTRVPFREIADVRLDVRKDMLDVALVSMDGERRWICPRTADALEIYARICYEAGKVKSACGGQGRI